MYCITFWYLLLLLPDISYTLLHTRYVLSDTYCTTHILPHIQYTLSHTSGRQRIFQTVPENCIKILTRMHSSRMCTARSSSRPEGVSTSHPPGSRPPPEQTPLRLGTPLGADPLDQAPPPPEQTPPNQAPLLQGMLRYHLQCMLGYHPPCEQND